MPAYTRAMSTTDIDRPAAPAADGCPTAVIPAVPVRRSILHQARPASQDEGAPFPDWRGQAVTEELTTVTSASAAHPRRPSRGTRARRHLRCALTGTLLAIVAITGLSAYAAQGIANARHAALCQAHITCK